MKIKINQEVMWRGKSCKVTTIRPIPLVALAVTDSDGIEEYVPNNYLQEFIKENEATT